MNKVYILAFGMFLVGLATQIGGLEHGWHDALTPQFVSGVILNVGSIVVAACTGKLIKE
jgi:hypothetical protein